MRARKPVVSLLAVAVAVLPLLVGCGAASTADPTSATATPAPSSVVAVPTGPTVTVPGLDETAAGTSSASSATRSTTVSSPAKTTATSSERATTVPPKSSTVDVTTTVTVPPPTPSTSKAAEPPATQHSTTSQPPSTTKAPVSTKQNSGGTMTRKVVVIDPGHNGQNNAHPEIITQQVPAGFGEMKDCNTTGTETRDGYTESLFNWKTALLLKEKLEAKGITVIMTRDSNDGVGPCVNERAAVGNDNNADAVVSIHGDGDLHESVHGFYVMTAERAPAGAAMAAESHRLATDIRDGLVGDGSTPSNSLGDNGLWQRSDLSGLNLSMRPTVMLEMGNMKSATDAGPMTSAAGQDKYAAGIAAGVVAFLVNGG
ncbi:N-acetylmuramoyl-L-alanine amidase [Nakamurella lactea]|uniref:N-acetylmuramoyl-L-alanine amidase n=1 Tax=Nakamurella lactea TaxID=459515 RepID=UPI0003F6CDD6|nr:N-acetylmuramoyl-L-alanine amidase [Nakamurella lactea]